MPRLAKQLTALAVEKARPKEVAYNLASGNGLYLCVAISGSKSWMVRYRLLDGRQRTIVIGAYPMMSLADAKIRAEEIHLAARTGKPIKGLRAEVKAAKSKLTQDELAAQEIAEDIRKHSFNFLSEAWLEVRKVGWADESYRKAKYVVRQYLQPRIGALDMRTLRTRDVTDPLRDLAAKAPSLAKKAVQYLNGVVEHCILEGIRDDDQVLRLRGVLPSHRGGHIPAVTREQNIGPLMRAIYAYEGHVVRYALLLAAWTALRPGVIASARWCEIDLEKAEWHISGMETDGRRRMKTGNDHIVSLPAQAVAMLSDMQKYSAGAEYVFPPVGKMNNAHLHRDALSRALRLMGFAGQHSTHGFRAMLRTVARERLGVDFDVLEAQLAHAKRDEIQAAYDRTRFDDERRAAMQRWADYLDEQVEVWLATRTMRSSGNKAVHTSAISE
ncbi:tyrosine-type recombinase/integrase [Bordetella petrii]|uniref:tyrosine-type recombinase/integrase n=1 Tax=Bordetella petrii TaxID=94624 RepID=UPI001A969C4E|nr:integrase arm-type DNA-binding domain-containing protein [Bordetella petrii]MBO1111824.1 integrase arm-type DNA-binding domain-containing protein [Bordetella petrii]